MKQDSNGVRTAQDLERKYNFSKMLGLTKNYEVMEKGLTKIENELTDMLNAFVINLKDVLDSQSEVSLWFYSGTPTLENEPYINWQNKDEHDGDLYYDKEIGYVYQFKSIENGYQWEINVNPDLIEAMALTNAETDTTTDHERRIFFNTPSVPYSNGDWWIKADGSLYICQLSKPETEEYEEQDFIISSNYVDTISEKIGDTIKVLKGTMTKISDNFVQFTDLSTGGSTTIAGENIKTGSITSNNYVVNSAGMKINLLDGIIDTKNFKTDTEGNVYLGESGKIMGGNGILTNLVYNGFVRGQLYVGNGDYIPLGRVGGGDSQVSAQTNELVFSFDLPNKFTPISAKIKLFHAPLLWDNVENNTITGYSRNLKLYKGNDITNLKIKLSPGGYIYSSGITLSEISNALGLNGFTGSAGQVTSIESIDLTNQINSNGANYFVIKDSENVLYTDNLNIFGRTGGVFGYIEILGYMTTEGD